MRLRRLTVEEKRKAEQEKREQAEKEFEAALKEVGMGGVFLCFYVFIDVLLCLVGFCFVLLCGVTGVLGCLFRCCLFYWVWYRLGLFWHSVVCVRVCICGCLSLPFLAV